MVTRGRSANEAIVFIYRYYGFNESVSNIIKKLQRERKAATGYPHRSSRQEVFIPSLGFYLLPFFSKYH